MPKSAPQPAGKALDDYTLGSQFSPTEPIGLEVHSADVLTRMRRVVHGHQVVVIVRESAPLR